MPASLLTDIKVMPVLSDGDLNAGATLSCDCIDASKFHDVLFVINYQTIGGAANYVKLYSGATDGALTTALTFNYAFAGAAQGSASADVFATWSTSANLSVAHASYDNYALLVEIDTAAITTAGHKYLTLVFADTDTGATGNVSVVAIGRPRYNGGRTAATGLA